MLVADRIAELLQREGAEFIVGFPENRLLNSAALRGIRPIITRTERVAVNIADGFARVTDGERLLPCVTQYGPGAESAFGAVAQAFGDRSPILLLPGEHAVDAQDSEPNFRTERTYKDVTRWSATLNNAARGPEVFRRAFVALRGARNGPVLVAIAHDVLNGNRSFPENHPLALGTAARTRPATVDRFFERADLILGIGTSFSRSLYITPMPADAVLGQIVDDRRDLASGYEIAFGCVGDARLVLEQLLEALDGADPNSRRTADHVGSARAAFLAEWMPRRTSDASPLSPYRIVWELMKVVDRSRTVVTHDAGHPRDQIVPFYETIVPRGYLGWGKSTQLGTSLGLTMGARLARPDWLAVNIMGDSAFGMVGMDLETAVRERITILTIVMNNGLMGGYREWMPDAVDRYGSNQLGGSYAEVGAALGAYTERVADPAELQAALQRCIASVESGRAALLEVMTHEEPALALP